MEASEALVKILEGVMQSHIQIVAALTRLEERQQEHNLALARALAENTQILAAMLTHVADTTSRTEQMTALILTEVSKGAPLK
jgi:hypothetical protein